MMVMANMTATEFLGGLDGSYGLKELDMDTWIV